MSDPEKKTASGLFRCMAEELLVDYQDFLRTKKLLLWPKEHRLVVRFRELNRTPNATYETHNKAIENTIRKSAPTP
jgi:hypothetical protein